jgi:two-component system nitrate/nitrite response regulator NarL
MGPPCRVVIADDHPFYRKGLVSSLRESGIDVVRDVANGDAAIKAVEETAPDLVLMDVNMPGVSGVEATRRLTELFPKTRVVMLSVSAEEADVVTALEAGATGYLLKESPPEEVIAAIRDAAAGRPVVSRRLAAMLLQPIPGLTDRASG